MHNGKFLAEKSFSVTMAIATNANKPTQPSTCKQVKCDAPKTGCKWVKDDTKIAATGCLMHPCGKMECAKPVGATGPATAMCKINPTIKDNYTLAAG
jgi:hypothetical protein